MIFHLTVMCPSLLDLVNGQITYGADTTPDFDVGTTATHACDRGYGLTEDAVRICTASADNLTASWSGNVPSCESEYYSYTKQSAMYSSAMFQFI